jgi:hypothetical protein
LRNRFTSGALAWNVVNNLLYFAHGLRNEVAPWRESAPQPLSFTPREKAVVDRGFPAERWDSLRDALSDQDGPT